MNKLDIIKFMNDHKIALGMEVANTELRLTEEKGWGRFAKDVIKKDEIIYRIGGMWLTLEERAEYAEYDLFWWHNGAFLFQGGLTHELNGSHNHSCNPNAYMEDGACIKALRDIDIGEEITVDYSSFIAHEGTIFDVCKCRSPQCRGKVTGLDWKLHNLVIKYKFKCSNDVINKFIDSTNLKFK